MARTGRIRRRRRYRGAASVEAVVVLPFFIIMFVAIQYVGRLFVAQQEAGIHARRCAWEYSMNNCEQIPKGCEGILARVDEGQAVGDEISSAFDKIGGSTVGDVVKAVMKPFLSLLFGEALNANTSRQVQKTNTLGGGIRQVKGHYHLACNLKNQTLTDVAKELWDAVF